MNILAAASDAPLTFWEQVLDVLIEVGWKTVAVVSIVVGAFLLSWVLRLLIRRVVQRIVLGAKSRAEVADTRAMEQSPLAQVRVVQRTRTLGSILQNIANVTIVVIAVILIVYTINADVIGSFTLLTAALGAGLGFGAQNIVRDVLNGIFIVAEDQVGIGDVVDLGLATGVVEYVSVRITHVRDVNGTLWYVRNGEILRIGNQTQGWSTGSVEVPVASDENPAKVLTILDGVADAVFADEKWKDVLLEKPNVAGVDKIAGGAMTVKIFAKCAPNQQWGVQRDLLERSLEALQKAGVKGPVQLPGRLPL